MEAVAGGWEEGKQNNACGSHSLGRTMKAWPPGLVCLSPCLRPQGVSAAARISSDRPERVWGWGRRWGLVGWDPWATWPSRADRAPPPEGAIRNPATASRSAPAASSMPACQLHRAAAPAGRRSPLLPAAGGWSTHLRRFWPPAVGATRHACPRARWKPAQEAPFGSRSVMLELPADLALASRRQGARRDQNAG